MFVIPASIPLGSRWDAPFSVVGAIATVVWETAALVRPLLALPLAALACALLIEVPVTPSPGPATLGGLSGGSRPRGGLYARTVRRRSTTR